MASLNSDKEKAHQIMVDALEKIYKLGYCVRAELDRFIITIDEDTLWLDEIEN